MSKIVNIKKIKNNNANKINLKINFRKLKKNENNAIYLNVHKINVYGKKQNG